MVEVEYSSASGEADLNSEDECSDESRGAMLEMAYKEDHDKHQMQSLFVLTQVTYLIWNELFVPLWSRSWHKQAMRRARVSSSPSARLI